MRVDPLNQEFIHLLQKSGWNQTRAALELHVEPATVSRYVSGQTRPSMTILKLFGRLLGERLLYVADDPRSLHESQPVMEEWETRLLLQIRALPVATRRKFVEGISGLLEAAKPPVNYRPPTAADVKAQVEADILSEVDKAIAERSPPAEGPKAKPSVPPKPPRSVR